MNDHIEVLRGLVAFLNGEAPLDGCWFDEDPPPGEGRYWWRKPLNAALAAMAAQAEAQAPEIGSEWKPCRKRPVVVHVREQRPGEQHVSTREGITPIKPDDLIMRGVAGEEYPIGRALFEQTYDLVSDEQPEAQAGGEVIAEVDASGRVKWVRDRHGRTANPNIFTNDGFYPMPWPAGTKLYTTPPPSAVPEGGVLWLWRHHDHFLAFTHQYPCFTPGGDPMTLGPPAGYAVFRVSHDRAAAPDRRSDHADARPD